MQDIFSLTWENFSSNILETFKGIKKSGQLHDVTLVCKDGEINAHKLILFGGSNFFQSVFTKNNHQHPLIYLKGIKVKNMEAILDFLYNGEVRIAEEDLKFFLETAEDLEINGLVQKERIRNTEQNIKEDFHDILDDIADSKEVLKRNTCDELLSPQASYTNISSENGKDLLRLDNNPNKIITTEKCEKSEVNNEIVFHDILQKFENLESDETLELMEKGIGPDGTRVWKCKLCDKRNSDKTRIRKHIRGQHLKKPVPVQEKTQYYISFKDSLEDFVTDEEFQRKVLSLMEKRMGDDQKVTWSCLKCNKSDGDKARIRKHVEEHITNLIFTCLFCEERRSRSIYMKKHIVSKHSENV